MDQLTVGDKINIRRSDGCVQSAVIGLKSIERQVVTVEWTQGTRVKGKEIPWNAVLELNPSLADNKSKDKPPKLTRNTSGFNMYRKKPTNSPYKKRQRVSSRSEVGSSALAKPKQSKVQLQPTQPVQPVAPPPPVPPTVVAPRSNVVRQVERMKEQRELRRAKQAEQRRERSELQSKDPGNPNWEVALMVRTYREQLQFNPLRCISPNGARTQQITVCVRKRPMSRREQLLKMVDVISVPSRDTMLVHELRNKVDLTKFLEHHKYRFDYIFDEESNNQLVYEYTARPLIRTMFDDGNATCFAYGQTGSGKTHTMGGEFCGKTQDGKTGIYALAAKDVFAELAKAKYLEIDAKVTCSYFEIYGSKVSSGCSAPMVIDYNSTLAVGVRSAVAGQANAASAGGWATTGRYCWTDHETCFQGGGGAGHHRAGQSRTHLGADIGEHQVVPFTCRLPDGTLHTRQRRSVRKVFVRGLGGQRTWRRYPICQSAHSSRGCRDQQVAASPQGVHPRNESTFESLAFPWLKVDAGVA